jgi:UbiD family decarboxylase
MQENTNQGVLMSNKGKALDAEKQSASVGWPTADLRDWIGKLENRKLLRRITAQVDWDRELGAITRAVFAKKGPALLFENIKDHQTTACRKLFVGGLATLERLRLCLGLDPQTSERDMVRHVRQNLKRGIPPVLVDSGPVHENIVMGDKIDLYQLPVPKWHHLDGGRFIDTWCGVVTKDPETGSLNIGIYRGMIVGKNKIAKLLLRTQDWGKHYTKWEALGKKMPIAIVYGWDEILSFVALLSCPHHLGQSEYDTAGALRGDPVSLVKCKTVDLQVPASAEIVIEGYIDAKELNMEGPFGEFTGWYGGGSSPKPTLTVECMTFRNDPIFRGTCEGHRPGMPNEEWASHTIGLSAIAWNVLDDAEVPGITDVLCHPATGGTDLYVQIHKQFRGHAKQVASALWGHKSAQWNWKNVTVVEEDIDFRNPDDMVWANAFRVNAGEGDVTIYGPTLGSVLDPSTRREERDALLYGTGRWFRVLIDATRNWDFGRWEEWENNVYPPVNKVSLADEKLIRQRWKEYDLGIPYLTDEEREKLTMENIMKVLPVVGLK